MNKYFKVCLKIIPLLLVLSSSCSPLACFDETESFLKASFYSYDTQTRLTPDSLTIYGLDRETNKLYNKALNVQPALFPLNSSTESCTYIVIINGKRDTLTFSYNSYPHLVSKECGYTFYHTLDTIPESKSGIIKFISISKSKITTINEENIRIYY